MGPQAAPVLPSGGTWVIATAVGVGYLIHKTIFTECTAHSGHVELRTMRVPIPEGTL